MHRYMIHILKLTQILQMLSKNNRRMHCLCFDRQRRWTHLLSVFWLWLLAPASPKALGYFLGDTKAVLNGCGDHWTLQDRTAMPLLFQMTVCVDIRVVVPGAWVAFSYSSIYAPRPELGLEGDDEALYGWLLRVRHRFPVRLSPQHWHRVCLRRDMPHNSFSLEVDGRAVSERTVIARAIPPSGSLWLGCRPRDRPPGTALGEVELYLFRMWADLGDHGLCEDGTVIGWNSRYWGVTSPKARQTDPYLLCGHRWLRHGVRVQRDVTGTQSRAGRSLTTLTRSTVNCDISQLCSSENVHFWMLISMTEIEEDIIEEEDVQQWVSDALCYHDDIVSGATCLPQLCQVDEQLKAVQVKCKIKNDENDDERDATCSVLVTLRRTCSASRLQDAIVSALQHHEVKHMRGEIIGGVIRVGLCEDVSPSSGKFVRCQSTLSLDDICQTNKLTCSPIESNSNSDAWPTTESNSMTCGSSELLVRTLSKFSLNWDNCDLKISDVSKSDQGSHKCGANKNLFVLLVENCPSSFAQSSTQPTKQPNSNEPTADPSETDTTKKPHITTATTAAVQQTNALEGTTQPTTTTPLTTNSRLQSSTAKPVPQTSSQNMPVTFSHSRTVENTALSDHATLPSVNSTLEMIKTALVDSSPDKTLLPNNNMSPTISTFTTSPKLKTEYNVTTAAKNRSQHNGTTTTTNTTTSTVTAFPNYTMMNNVTTTNKNYTTAFNKVTTPNNITKVDNNGTHNMTSSSISTTHSSVTPSLKHTTVANVTTSTNSYKKPPKYNTTEYNVATASKPGEQHSSTTGTSNTYVSTITLFLTENVTTATNNYTTESSDDSTEYTVTTDKNMNLHNETTTTTNTTISIVTAFPNDPIMNNETTTNKNYTTAFNKLTTDNNISTVDNNGTHNMTSSSINTTHSSVTPSLKHTMLNNVTTSTNSYITSNSNITEYNVATASKPGNQHNSITPTSNTNVSTIASFLTENVTTAKNNYTAETSDDSTKYNVTTLENNRNLHYVTTTASNTTVSAVTVYPNDTMINNLTTTNKNYTTAFSKVTTDNSITTMENNWTHNMTSSSINTTSSSITPSPKHTTVAKVTTSTNSYITSNSNITEYNVATASKPGEQHNSTTITSNTSVSTLTSIFNQNQTTATKHYTTESGNDTTKYTVTTDNNRNIHNVTTTTTNTTISAVTAYPNDTMMNNETTATKNYTTAFSKVTTDNNITTVDNNGTHNMTSSSINTTSSSITPSPKHTMLNNVTTSSNSYITSNSNITEYIVATASSSGNQHNSTTGTFNTNVSTTASFLTENVTTAKNNYTTESSDDSTKYTVTTLENNRNIHNETTTASNTTISTMTVYPNDTMINNLTTTNKNYTTAFNKLTTDNSITTVNNIGTQKMTSSSVNTTSSSITPSVKHTMVNNVTTSTNSYITSNSNITEYNVATASKPGEQHNSTTITSNTSVSTLTSISNQNRTTATKHYSTESGNDTTKYTVTTDNNRNLRNETTTTTNTTVSAVTAYPNDTMMNNETTATKNYTTAFSKVTTDNNITTVENNGTHNMTSSSINTSNSITPPPTQTVVYLTTAANNLTTGFNHYTTENSDTTVDKNGGKHNTTVTTTNATMIKLTFSPNYTAVNNVPTASYHYTTSENVNTLSLSPNNDTTENTTTSPHRETQQNPTISFTAEQVESLNNLTSSTKNSTVDDMTSVVNNSTGNHLPNTTALKVTTTAETTNIHEAQVEQVLGDLLDQTQNVSQLNSSQMVQMTGQLEKLLDGPTVSQAMGQNAVNIISNLMESKLQALSTCANRLVRLIDDLSLKLVVSGEKEVVSSNSLVLAVWKVDGTNFTTTFVDIFNTQDVQIKGFQSGRSVSALGSVFLPWSLTTGLSPEQQQEASRVQFTYYTKPTLFHDSGLDNNTLVSPVLGSSVANLSINNLSENIQFTIQNPMHGNYSVSCVFWDFSLNDGGGGWSKAGCFLVNTTADDTTCSCSHLTSFAILLDLSREGLTDPKQAQILSYITYIGCGISSVFLAVTLLTYLLFEKLLRDIPAKILVQFCMSLLLVNLAFMLDGWLALYKVTGLCISTAFFLHYFLLTSFTWAGLEALHMYLSVIKVFTPYLSRYMLKFSLMGWGIPLVVVITVISVDKDNYGLVTYGKYANGSTDDFCWIRNDIAFYVGVVAYFLLIFTLCLLVFIMVMVQLARIKKQNPHNQTPNRGLLTDMRSITGIIILLGLTWGCALFAWGPVHLPFTYLFSIFNSLQGFFVFVFHCAAKENVRRQWKTYLCCGRLRLAENSEWSRMATQNNKTLSVTTSTTPTPHFPSRSSSLVSDGTSSSGSVLADSGISDGFGSDVVLNEIHRQNMPVKTAPSIHWCLQ